MMTKDEALRGLTIGDCRTRREAVKTVKELLNREECEDAISRTEVIKSIDEREDVNGKVDAESVRTDIVLMQPVNPQPKTGYREYNDIYDHYLCGNCKTVVMDYDNFCPNCGYRMVEPQERSGEE